MVNIDNVLFIDTPYGGSQPIPDKNDFGVRIRLEMSTTDGDGQKLMEKMIRQIKEGRVKVVNMMDWQEGNKGHVDVALVFSR